jgi:glutamate synthase (NADPH/NADH) small chain
MTYRTTSAHEEGGERLFAVSTEAFLDDGTGQLAALRIVDVEVSDGAFEPVAGSTRELPADVVLLAMGFTGPEPGSVVEQLGLDLDDRGLVKRYPDYRTDVGGVYVCGDAGRGQSLIVWAIAEGRAGAAAVDKYLTGTTNLPAPIAATAQPLVV